MASVLFSTFSTLLLVYSETQIVSRYRDCF